MPAFPSLPHLPGFRQITSLDHNVPLHVVFASWSSYEDELNTEREVLSSGPGMQHRAQKYHYHLRNEGLSTILKMVEKMDGMGRRQSTLRHSIRAKD